MSLFHSRAKGLLIGFYVPLHFAATSGHFRSALARRAVARDGSPIPWYAYPAVEFLQRVDFGGADVLGYGGGQSTVWWADRGRTVTTVEDDAGWRRRLGELVGGRGNVTVLESDADVSGDFDVIVIDGGMREPLAEAAPGRLRPGGLIIFDNANGRWFTRAAAAFEGAGLLRIDFYGYAAGVRRPNVTSLAFRPDTPYLRNVSLPPQP